MSSTSERAQQCTALTKVTRKKKHSLTRAEITQEGLAGKKPTGPVSTAGNKKTSVKVVSAASKETLRPGKNGEGEDEKCGPRTYGHPSETWGWTPPSRFKFIPDWARELPQLKIEKVRERKRAVGMHKGRGGGYRK